MCFTWSKEGSTALCATTEEVVSVTKTELQTMYEVMFTDYPDIVNVAQVQSISCRTAWWMTERRMPMPVLDGDFEAFVTNLGKYNEGMLVGEWVKLPTTEEEMQKVFERIGIGKQDEFGQPYEEWFITDYESPSVIRLLPVISTASVFWLRQTPQRPNRV